MIKYTNILIWIVQIENMDENLIELRRSESANSVENFLKFFTKHFCEFHQKTAMYKSAEISLKNDHVFKPKKVGRVSFVRNLLQKF